MMSSGQISNLCSTTRLGAQVLLLALVACGKAGLPLTKGAPSIPNPILQNFGQCQNGTMLSYENFGEAFMLNYCTSCHARDVQDKSRNGAPNSVNLDRPADMALWRTKMLALVGNKDTATMPPSLHVNERDRRKLIEWLVCGAPASIDSVTGAADQ